MMGEVGDFVLLLLLNALIVWIYVIWNGVKKRDKRSYVIKATVMFICPVIGPAFFLLSQLFLSVLFSQQVDLEDVIFSKERVKTYQRADEERESNMVSIKEAIAVSDKESLRSLMLNVVKGDIQKSLGAISEALNSEDTETAHYAASVLQEQLNDFRMRVHKLYHEVQKTGRSQMGKAEELLDYMNPILEQKVFSDTEQKSMVEIMDEVCETVYEQEKGRLTAAYYEMICMRLLEIGNFERCNLWCDRGMEYYPYELSSYTCMLKLYFTCNDGEKFFATLDRLKKSEIIIDSETLELIRTFS
ncbi:MAG: hypothetical protein IJ282_09535 [Lachnospiraceae bacterium]|nr:hypothetical protein [Lachnospiraceae bacterium]